VEVPHHICRTCVYRLRPNIVLPHVQMLDPEIQALVGNSARRVLDIGCATGRLGCEIKNKVSAEVWGIEKNINAANIAKKSLNKVYVGDVNDILPLLPHAYFDTIILADVIEHLINPWDILKNCLSILENSGKVIISIPNVRHWSVIRGLIEGRWEYENKGLLDRTHLRFFTRSNIPKL
ncbi:MAG: class I SAM-dependent methyltransferase, partial [Sulfurimonas sp.]